MLISLLTTNPSFSSQVLATLRTVAAPDPFPLKDQYVPNVQAARDADGEHKGDDEEGSDEAAAPKGSKRKGFGGDGKPWNYNGVRKSFMGDLKAKGLSFEERKELWDASETKRNYLKPISVQELKRRKFISKDCKTNPWAQ